MPALTPSQTIGPFFHEGLKWAVEPSAHRLHGDVARVTGRLLDVDANGVTDGVLEVWQPGWAASRDGLPGFQRIMTDQHGRFSFAMPNPGPSAVCANVTVFARGLLCELFTRVYLPGTGGAPAPRLPASVPAERRDTLLAKRLPGDAGASPAELTFEWNIRLRGEGETVFFQL